MNNSASAQRPPGLTRGSKLVFGFVPACLIVSWLWTEWDRPALSALCNALTAWGRFHLGLVTPASPLLWILMPTMLMVALAGSLLLLFEKPPDQLRLPVGAVFLCLQAAYLAFRLAATLCLDTLPNAIFSLLFFLSELSIHVRIALGNLSLLRLTDRRAEADASARLVRDRDYLPTVDVFVPTYSEPVEMLERTIIGCQAMDYPYKTVWLLDDQRRPAMRELARTLGCCYLDRPDNSHAKAGNLNHALQRSEGELVLCFDADFIPTRDFLQRTVGFFRDAKVALVQTPQNFFNEDAVQRNLGLERALEDEQRLFFRTLQPGRDSFNAIVCHGTCWVGRRSALEEIGGIPTETITEDWATSIKLQAAGYKLLYLNEALSAGLSADTCGEFVQQRSRWAQGTLQALFASTNPLTIPGLNWKQRLLHFSGILYYAGSVSNLFNLLAPLLYLFCGVCILRMSIAEMIFFRLPFTVGYYMLYSWLTLRNRSALWTEFYDAFLAPSMGLTVLQTFCRPFGRGFRVTDKTQRPQRITMNRRVALPFIILLALHLAGLAFAFATGRHIDQPDIFPMVAYFAAGNLVVLWVCLLVSMDIRRARAFPRFEHRLAFELAWDGGSVEGETILMSESEVTIPALSMAGAPHRIARPCREEGTFRLTPALSLGEREPRIPTLDNSLSAQHAKARTAFLPLPLGEGRGEGKEMHLNSTDQIATTSSCRGRQKGLQKTDAWPKSPATLQDRGLLCLPSLGLVDVPVRLRQDTDGQWSLEFAELSLSQRRALVEFLYCRPGQWEAKPKGEVRAVWEYARAAGRMYPLAESI